MTDSPKKRPNMVGIQAYTDDVKDQPEIDSPMRKKKRNLGSLDIKPQVAEKEEAAPDASKDRVKYDVIFG